MINKYTLIDFLPTDEEVEDFRGITMDGFPFFRGKHYYVLSKYKILKIRIGREKEYYELCAKLIFYNRAIANIYLEMIKEKKLKKPILKKINYFTSP